MKKIDISKDIYYSKNYASLYPVAGESIFEFEYREASDRFYNLAIKRPITQIGESRIGDGYYDLETAYGYGGYLSTSTDARFLDNAMHAYQQKCMDEKIIAEFVRFHPYNPFPMAGKRHMDFIALDQQERVGRDKLAVCVEEDGVDVIEPDFHLLNVAEKHLVIDGRGERTIGELARGARVRKRDAALQAQARGACGNHHPTRQFSWLTRCGIPAPREDSGGDRIASLVGGFNLIVPCPGIGGKRDFQAAAHFKWPRCNVDLPTI